MKEEVAPTEEALKVLLDYLVDPMLPLKAKGKDPPSLAHQQSVAKQMHAVVLLYNFYHRKQHPELCFLEYQSFCKLALTLKPALLDHMKFTHPTGSTRSNDLENQLSVTEKAIMDACNISLSLDELNDVRSTEAWPITKVSVLLIDSKKENCVLLYDSITNGVWSVIENSIDVSNLDSEILSEGRHAKIMKRRGNNTQTDKQSAAGLGSDQHAFSAVKEATGINQSELMVLERHVVYSLSEEKTAAYFYIMQCTESSNEGIEVPIKDAIESLQGPLFKWISGNWTHTPMVEYYDMLPYAVIISSWYSREVSSISSQRLNVSSCQRTEVNCGEKIAEREQVISNGLQNFNVEMGNIKFNSSLLENPCDGETKEYKYSNDLYPNDGKSTGNDTIVCEKSKSEEKEAQETEQSDKSCDISHPTVKQLGNCIDANCSGTENSKGAEKEVNEYVSNDVHPNAGKSTCNDTTIGDKSKSEKKEAQETEQSDKSCEISHPAVKQLENCIGENCSGTETSGTDNSKGAEKEVEETGKSDKFLDINHSTVKQLENCVDLNYIGKETIRIENSKRAEKEVEDTEKCDTCDITYSTAKELRSSISVNSSGKEKISVDNSKWIIKVVEDTEKSDMCCDTVNFTVNKLSNHDSEASKQCPTNESQLIPYSPNMRQKVDVDGVIMNIQKNGEENMSPGVPIRVYHHQKRKITMESDTCASLGGVGTNVTSLIGLQLEAAGTPKSTASEIREGKVAENCIDWTISSNLNGIPETEYAVASFEPSVETLQTTVSKNDIAMTQTALGVLFSKRAKLCHHQRLVQDEIALCDRKIQKILEGNEDALAVKLDAIMDGCKDTCFKDNIQEESYQNGEGYPLIQCTRGKRLCDAILNLQSPSQDLNDICRENNWTLAINSVAAPDGGFLANVTVEGMDFDSSCGSHLLSTPQEAKNSAAAQMIAQLRSMAGHI